MITFRNWDGVGRGVVGPFTFQILYFCNILTFTSVYYFCIFKKNYGYR